MFIFGSNWSDRNKARAGVEAGLTPEDEGKIEIKNK